MTVLIVDDELELLNLMEEIIKYRFPRVKIQTAVDGMQGLERIRSHRFKLLITDLDMPNMTGTDLIKNVEKLDLYQRPEHVIVISGYLSEEQALKLNNLSPSTIFMAKPIKEKDLTLRLNKYF